MATEEYVDNKTESGTGYIKYADGTLICYGKTTTATISAGSEYSETITLPQGYLDTDFTVLVSITSGGSNWAGGIACRGKAQTTNSIQIIAGNYISTVQAENIIVSYMAIGKWK